MRECLKCPNCRAPLPPHEADSVTCGYCGYTTRSAVRASERAEPAAEATEAVPGRRVLVWVLIVVGGALLLGGGITVWVFSTVASSISEVVDEGKHAGSEAVNPCQAGEQDRCFARARSVELQGDQTRAERLYAKACDLGSAMGCYNGGVLALRRGDWSAAEAPLKRGCEGGHATACTNLSVVLDRQGKTKQALEVAREACEAGSALGCNNAASYVEEEDRHAACRLFVKACDMGSALGCSAASSCSLEQKDCKKAKRYANEAIRKQALPGALANLGHACLFCGDAEMAWVYYRKALQAEATARDTTITSSKHPVSHERAQRDAPLLEEIRSELSELSRKFPERRRAALRMRKKLLQAPGP